uniref:Homing endonuclease LAGLIDADG domain-containing protein n=1 Tax=Microbotryum cf. violaceum BFL-2013 TaxID=1288119 RepID=M1GLX2_9BASI|nr:hypothetical protein H888_mgp26 [Microbotryum cf. violaceum BFL-2013]AGE14632.1 hypothetical protein [Microbotryum cf. violaceum BFL-2013]
MRVEQRKYDPNTNASYLGIMTIIADALNVPLSTSKHNGGVEYFLIEASTVKSRVIIVNYFSTFLLFSSKLLNFLDWLACHKLIESKQHITPEGRNTALNLKANMNTKRAYLNWDHLDKFNTY